MRFASFIRSTLAAAVLAPAIMFGSLAPAEANSGTPGSVMFWTDGAYGLVGSSVGVGGGAPTGQQIDVSACWLGQGCYFDRESPNGTSGYSLTSTVAMTSVFGSWSTATGQDYTFNIFTDTTHTTLAATAELRNWATGDSCNGLPTCTDTNSLVAIFNEAVPGGSALTPLSGATTLEETSFTNVGSGVLNYQTQPLFSATCTNGSCPVSAGFLIGPIQEQIAAPEPVSAALFGVGLAGLGMVRRGRRVRRSVGAV